MLTMQCNPTSSKIFFTIRVSLVANVTSEVTLKRHAFLVFYVFILYSLFFFLSEIITTGTDFSYVSLDILYSLFFFLSEIIKTGTDFCYVLLDTRSELNSLLPNLLYGGVDFSLPGEGGPACVEVILTSDWSDP